MKRKITSFHQDEHQDWIAELECFHGQHVRHKPPFFNRPWVESEAGRTSMLGVELDCVRCDRLEWPDGLVAYKRTPEFTEQTIPAGLQKDHTLKIGAWGRICIVSGSLTYTVEDAMPKSFELDTETSGTIAPGVRHHLTVKGQVVFYVEFFSRPVTGVK
jgi:tellurite resistance-related uncharacterized protein